MGLGDAMQAQLLARIEASPHQLTIHYPAARVGATGAVPFAQPASPLTGPPVATVVPTPDSVGAIPDVVLACLWYDRDALRAQPDFKQLSVGWSENVRAVARVAVQDAALDPALPWGGTKFDSAEYVIYNQTGFRYRVETVKAVSASFLLPVSYLVVLTGGYAQ